VSFCFPVRLYLASARQGLITFHSFVVKETSDYTCEPQGILVHDEAKDLLRQIRRSPLSREGVIGNFVWQAG
jgi:hypothetical protein